MPLKIAGNIGPVRIVSKNESEKCPQTFCCHRLSPIRITRFHRRFLKKQEIVHYNQMAKELSLSTDWDLWCVSKGGDDYEAFYGTKGSPL